MFERFTERAIMVIMLAQEEARRLGHNFVGTEQVLLGLIGEGTGVAAKTLKSMGITLKEARAEVEKILGRGSGFVAVEIPFTPRAKRVLEFSWDEARQLRHNYIGTEHLLLGLLREGEGVAARVLDNLNIDIKKVVQVTKNNIEVIENKKNNIDTQNKLHTKIIAPELTKSSNETINKNFETISELNSRVEVLERSLNTQKTEENVKINEKQQCIFIGHGGSPLWNAIVTFLTQHMQFEATKIHYFEKESRAGIFTSEVISEMLNKTTFAIIIMTADDEIENEKVRARQNVIHEIGLFQGKLGYNKVAILKQEGVEEFSNIAGLQYIGFKDQEIDQTFWKLQEMLKREEIINNK